MKKNVSILFSSGLDSTYLMWKNLKKGNTVTPYYINIKNNEAKSLLEQNRARLLIKMFQEEFPYKVSDLKVGIDISINISFDSTLKYVQMPIWILSLLYCTTETTDEFQLGYVCGDDMVSYIDDIQKIYKSYSSILRKKVKLTFPLIKTCKRDMLENLPENYFNLTVTCEQPIIVEKTRDSELIEYVPCCECDPCKKIIANHVGTRYHGYGKIYHKPNQEKMINVLCYNSFEIKDDNFRQAIEVYTKGRHEVCLPQVFTPQQLEIPFEHSDKIENCVDERPAFIKYVAPIDDRNYLKK